MTVDAPHDSTHALVRMANQISIAFRAQPHDKAVAATAEHIRLYWSRKMRADLLAHLAAGGAGLEAMSREAAEVLRGEQKA